MPASILLVIISLTFTILTRFELVPAQYLPLTVILFLALLFTLGSVLVVASVIAMGKLAQFVEEGNKNTLRCCLSKK